DGEVTALATAHTDSEKAKRMGAYFDGRRPPQSMPCIKRGEPELVPEITEAFIEQLDEGCRRLVTRVLNAKSYIGVPLKRGAKIIGAIVLFSCEAGRPFDTSDLNVAIALAERAAIAVENARLFQELVAARAEADAKRAEAELANRAKDEFLAVLG